MYCELSSDYVAMCCAMCASLGLSSPRRDRKNRWASGWRGPEFTSTALARRSRVARAPV